MNTRLILAACVLAVATASSPRAQQPPSAADRPKFGTSTAAVVVDVIVRDKKGHPVVDLTKDDFEVLENGTVQTLLDFQRALPGASTPQVTAASSTPAGAPVAVVGAGSNEAPLKEQAVTAIVFDWLTMKSCPSAASPPTWVLTPSTATARTSGTTSVPAGLRGASGLIASSRTTEPRR